MENFNWRMKSLTAQGCVMEAFVQDHELRECLSKITYGNWQNKFYECGGNIICSIGIVSNDTISFKDASGYSPQEAFRNACLMWNVGLEVSLMPTVLITTFPRALEDGVKYTPMHNPEKGDCPVEFLIEIDGKPSPFIKEDCLNEYVKQVLKK